MKDRMLEILNLSLELRQKKGLKQQLKKTLLTLFWLIILINKKKLNRVMLNGDDNENGFKTNRSN